jgi:hypothetical protein
VEPARICSCIFGCVSSLKTGKTRCVAGIPGDGRRFNGSVLFSAAWQGPDLVCRSSELSNSLLVKME